MLYLKCLDVNSAMQSIYWHFKHEAKRNCKSARNNTEVKYHVKVGKATLPCQAKRSFSGKMHQKMHQVYVKLGKTLRGPSWQVKNLTPAPVCMVKWVESLRTTCETIFSYHFINSFQVRKKWVKKTPQNWMLESQLRNQNKSG